MSRVTLFLLFKIGTDRFVLDCAQVIEVLPLLAYKTLPQTYPGIAGVFDYRGVPTPVIDLSQVTIGLPAQAKISTRLIIVSYLDATGQFRPLGLIAEQATKTVSYAKEEFANTNVDVPGTPFLGSVISDALGLIQWVDAQKLIPPELETLLFQQLAGQL